MIDPQPILDQELACLAFCWRLDRRDGVTIGLTSHDRDLRISGVVYHAAPGLVPSAITQGSSLDAQSMDLKGALTSDVITVNDLDAGRWDGASLSLHLTEWTAPGEVWLELSRGELGTVERDGEQFTAELLGPATALGKPVVPETSPNCRAQFGDAACRIDLAKYRQITRATGFSGTNVVVAGGGMTPGIFAFGTLRWLTGANAGVTQLIGNNDTTQIMLTDAPPFAGGAGCLVLIAQGCDKSMATCSTRFANAINFRGEPNLPGNDLLTRYPGA
ncbi:MAG: DUF2163 domain-containing protein [Sphingobium sp.]